MKVLQCERCKCIIGTLKETRNRDTIKLFMGLPDSGIAQYDYVDLCNSCVAELVSLTKRFLGIKEEDEDQ